MCRENADGGIFVFSFSDRNGFEDLDTHLTKVTQSLSNVCPIVVGNRYVTFFEQFVFRPLLRVWMQLHPNIKVLLAKSSQSIYPNFFEICEQV